MIRFCVLSHRIELLEVMMIVKSSIGTLGSEDELKQTRSDSGNVITGSLGSPDFGVSLYRFIQQTMIIIMLHLNLEVRLPLIL